MEQPNETIDTLRHTCNRKLVVIRRNGIEIICDKCHGDDAKVLISWRKLLLMMIMAESVPELERQPSLDDINRRPMSR